MYGEFKNITGYDIEDYLRRFVDFITNNSQVIIDYYSGLIETLDRDSYSLLQSLLKESSFVINLFDLYIERFNTVNFWELMEFADDIKIKLETINNFSKFARSSVSKESFSTDVSVEVALGENETIEELIAKQGSTNRDEDWVQVALSNQLIQEDYDLNGGTIVSINFRSNSKFFIESIVDNPEGEKIKGLDLDKYLQFEDNDLKVLGYDDTLLQSISTLLSLKKNDNPEFPEYGIDPSLVTGSSLKSILLPSMIRQLYQTFATDDVVKQVQILETEIDQDSLNLSLNVVIQSGEEQQRILAIGN